MSQLSKMRHSREQWKHKAKRRGERECYQRKQYTRLETQYHQTANPLKATQAQLCQLEAQLHVLLSVPKVEVVHLALQLFCVARVGFRAVSRVLTFLAVHLGIQKAPCPHTILNWGIRLSIVRLESAQALRGLPLPQAPFTNGLIWMIDISIGLGQGKILALLALDAHHHQRQPGRPALRHVRCMSVSVAAALNVCTLSGLLR